jgi:hypothetical protein
MRDRTPGFAVLDEASQMELITLLQSIESKASLSLWDAKLDRITQERAEARDAAEHEAVADDFNGPVATQEYERFLPLIACAGSHDRLHALEVWKHQGVEAAIRYLERCNITPEADHGEEADDSPRGVFDRLKRLENELSAGPLGPPILEQSDLRLTVLL